MSPGLYTDLPFDQYALLDALNASLLKEFGNSAAHFKYAFDQKHEPKTDTTARDDDAFFIGRAVHCCVLEPERFANDYIIAPCEERRAAAYKKMVADNPDKSVLTNKEHTMITGISESLKHPRHSYANMLLCNASYNELTGVWIDTYSGVLCKCRADRYIHNQVGEPFVIDLKTATSANEDAFSRAIHAYGYHVSAAFYLDGFTTITKREHTKFIFLVVEKTPPYEVAIYDLHPDSIAKGREIYRSYLSQYASCKIVDVYPGYPNELRSIGLPYYALSK